MWLWLTGLDFAPILRAHTHKHNHCGDTFHDIIGFIRSRTKQEPGPVAGLLSMLSTAEGDVVGQKLVLLLLSTLAQRGEHKKTGPRFTVFSISSE